jgi:hypothetical protein
MEAQFKDLKFNNYKRWHTWREKNTKYMIDFVDKGHDLSRFWVHETGEILDSDSNKDIYIGKFVDVNRIVKNEPIYIFDNNTWIPYMNLVVEEF